MKINQKLIKKNLTDAYRLGIKHSRNNIPYAELSGDEPKRIGGTSQLNPLINGSWEVFTIVEAIFRRSLYKIKNNF
tara:strand:+ start:108 stop:335 length:228 start_codon:yes stop_codon:yes gene_type:complete